MGALYVCMYACMHVNYTDWWPGYFPALSREGDEQKAGGVLHITLLISKKVSNFITADDDAELIKHYHTFD